jgi:ankyrin repeat protein
MSDKYKRISSIIAGSLLFGAFSSMSYGAASSKHVSSVTAPAVPVGRARKSKFNQTYRDLNRIAQRRNDEGRAQNFFREIGVDTQNEAGNTLLILAVSRKHTEATRKVIKALIENGANVEVHNDNGETPLYWAACSFFGEDPELVQFLINKGADVNRQDNYSKTPLHVVAMWGGLGIAQVLLNNGANVNAQDKVGDTPLDEAIRREIQSIANFLRSKGAKTGAELAAETQR